MNEIRNIIIIIMISLLATMQGCGTAAAKDHVIKKMESDVGSAAKAGKTNGKLPENVSRNLIPTINLGSTEVPKINDEKRFDISVNNVPADQFFLSLVDGTDYNMVIHPEVTGTITLKTDLSLP